MYKRQVSDDETVYTVKMIKSQWSNGEEVTANDFVYSWNRAADEKTAADYAYLFDIIARNDDGSLAVEATDDYTLKITLTNPCPYFNDLMAFPTYFPVYQKLSLIHIFCQCDDIFRSIQPQKQLAGKRNRRNGQNHGNYNR